jgi:hypothetical protein
VILALCLGATLGVAEAALPVRDFTLAWTHSVEKTAWEEDWRIRDDGRLTIAAARVRGSGAGMEPPADAVLVDGAWTYRPVLPPQAALRLTRSHFTADYRLCWQGGCMPLDRLIPVTEDGAVTLGWGCPR